MWPMRMFGRRPKVKGLIGFYKLQDWWLSEFTEAEREYMEATYHPMGNPNPSPLTQGEIADVDMSADVFLNGMSTWFRRPEDQRIRACIREKIKALAESEPVSESGYYAGRHFTTYVDDVNELRQNGQAEEEETLLLRLIEEVEADASQKGYGVAPWYYEQLAKLYRTRKDYDSEVGILQRYAGQKHAPGVKPAKLAARLERAQSLFARSKGGTSQRIATSSQDVNAFERQFAGLMADTWKNRVVYQFGSRRESIS